MALFIIALGIKIPRFDELKESGILDQDPSVTVAVNNFDIWLLPSEIFAV